MRVALNGLFLDSPATGTGQYLREIVRALRELSPADSFTFIAPHADPTGTPPLTVAPTRLKSENLAKLEFEQVTFPRAVSRGFDLAHVPHFGPPYFPRLPTVVTIHDLIPLVLPAYRGSLLVRLYSQLAAAGARRAAAVITDSEASARDIEKHLQIPRARLYVVYLAADARYQPTFDLQELARVQQKYGLAEKFVLYLGGFDVRKNVKRVLEAFAGSRARQLGYNLVLAGQLPSSDSSFFPDPLPVAASLGIRAGVRRIGFVADADKPALYASARVFLYPSRYEGFGLPPLEAMACGTPVIVSNISSLPEVVGSAGILLDPDDAAGWQAALDQVLTDDARWNELRAVGKEQAARFSWQRAARETLAVYRTVV